jgi:Cdc6-like AAA superfamily ATPase
MKRMGSFFGETTTTTTTSTSSSPSGSPVMDQNRRELVFKILVVGDIGAGKTAIIRRAVDNIFSDAYKVHSSFHFLFICVLVKGENEKA